MMNNITTDHYFKLINTQLTLIQFLEQMNKTLHQNIKIDPDYASVLMYLRKHKYYSYSSSMWYQRHPAVIHGLQSLNLITTKKATHKCTLTDFGKDYVKQAFPHWRNYGLMHRTVSITDGFKAYFEHDKFLIFITAINLSIPPYRDTLLLALIGIVLPILAAILIGMITPYNRTGVKSYNRSTCKLMLKSNQFATQKTFIDTFIKNEQYARYNTQAASNAIALLDNGMFKRQGCHYNHDEHYYRDYLNQ